MPGLMEDLLGVLEEQAENYSNLLGLSLEKKDVIVANDVEYLQKITSLENTLVGKSQKLEKKRLQLTEDIGLVLNRKPSELTLTALAELHKNKPEYERLTKVSESIKTAITKLKEVNNQNKTLIQNSLDYIDFSMNLIRNSATPGAQFYTAKGEQMNSGEAFFDAKQ